MVPVMIKKVTYRYLGYLGRYRVGYLATGIRLVKSGIRPDKGFQKRPDYQAGYPASRIPVASLVVFITVFIISPIHSFIDYISSRRFSDGRFRKSDYRVIVDGLSSHTSWQVSKTPFIMCVVFFLCYLVHLIYLYIFFIFSNDLAVIFCFIWFTVHGISPF
jgi:hypothetical protein